MTAPEIEKAAHGFMKDARNIDTQHDFQAGVGGERQLPLLTIIITASG
ncbi:Putative phage serine protease XkdF [Terribacillus halophilus]|uniref:Putative phage serine protease XkdF n=1 Tax=Terribacillus halophilus TaxID=361279 RepID=A0A1G6J5N1_9BACI|nr:Putative phage serine protease XkdF [Terribacillus halophilus]